MFKRRSDRSWRVSWRLRRRLVFTSYRRRDSADATGRICDRLVRRYGHRRVIRDVASFPLGVDFRDYIEHIIPQCQVVLAIIGPEWQVSAATDGRRWLDDPKDLVGFELACALRHGVRVIPVLVGDATIPDADSLPEALKPIAGLHGVAVRRDPDFEHDIERLIAGI